MRTLAFLAAILTSLAVAQAQNFTVNMNGAQEPGGGGTGSGSGTLTLNTTLDTLTFHNITFSGLSAPSSAGSIFGPVGTFYGPFYILGEPAGTPGGFFTLGSTSGSINGTLQLRAGVGFADVPTQITQLEGGIWYINITDGLFPAGDIRGQILPVPEPSTLPLLGIGVCGLWLLM